jgi:geranylgeranylglycerol-phosphate geranylgeranyltransferase
MRLSAFLTIIRPVNAVVSGLTAILAYLIATGTVVSGVLLLFLVVLCITGAGNAINDYYDAEIDRINRPGRPIPVGAITEKAALGYSLILFAAGMILSYFTNLFCAAIAVFNSLLLVWYASRLKGVPFAGNLAVSYLSGSIFLFGGAFAGPGGIFRVVPIAAITFLGTLGRELLKDAEDVTGDAAGGARTVPLVFGVRRTAALALFVVVIAIWVSLVPFAYWGTGYLLLIAPVDLLALAGVISAIRCRSPDCIKKTRATTLIKVGMYAALAVFTVSALLL